jgi:hypothetical protein
MPEEFPAAAQCSYTTSPALPTSHAVSAAATATFAWSTAASVLLSSGRLLIFSCLELPQGIGDGSLIYVFIDFHTCCLQCCKGLGPNSTGEQTFCSVIGNGLGGGNTCPLAGADTTVFDGPGQHFFMIRIHKQKPRGTAKGCIDLRIESISYCSYAQYHGTPPDKKLRVYTQNKNKKSAFRLLLKNNPAAAWSPNNRS